MPLKQPKRRDCITMCEIFIKKTEFLWKQDMKRIACTDIIDDLRFVISASSPMYEFLIEAYDNAFNEGLINADYYKR